jgi:hypothetical protein
MLISTRASRELPAFLSSATYLIAMLAGAAAPFIRTCYSLPPIPI